MQARNESFCQGAANEILSNVFGPTRKADLPELLVYLFKDGHEKDTREPMVVLMEGNKERGKQDHKIVRVLDREAVVWLVLLVETKGDRCPAVDFGLTAIADARPSVSTTPNDLFAAIIQRNEQERAATEPMGLTRQTYLVGKLDDGGSLCEHIEHLTLQPNSVNRLRITRPDQPDEASAEVRGVDEVWVFESELRPPNGSEPALKVVVSRPGSKPSEPQTHTYYYFANSRLPHYGGSLAFGSSLLNVQSGHGCINTGECSPSLYAFAFATVLQFPRGREKWCLIADWSLALALGARLLDPAFGEVTGGIRFGIGQAWSKSLSRFGLIVGITYPFRTSDSTSETVSTTVTTPAGPQTTTTQVSPQANHFHLFAAVDFAF